MDIKLAYGRHGLTVTLPDTVDVLEPRFLPGLPDEKARRCGRLCTTPSGSAPLAELVDPGDSVVVVHTDITRATPNDRILPVLLSELEAAGVRRDDITSAQRPWVLTVPRQMLNCEPCWVIEIVENYRCLQHDCMMMRT